MAKHRWLLAWGLGSVAAGAASLLIPLYVVQLGATPFDLGLLGAVAAFIGAPGAIVWGRIADRTTNARRVLLFSLAGTGVVLAGLPVASSIPLLIAGNAVVWLVYAAGSPVLTLLVVADVPEAEWNEEIALFNTYQGYGWTAGLLLGIVWSATAGRVLSPLSTQRSLLVVCGAVAVVAGVLLARWMPTPTDRQLRRVNVRRVARLLSTRRRSVRGATFLFTPGRLYWTSRNVHPKRFVERFTRTLAVYYVAVVFVFVGFAAFFAPLPLYLTGVGFSADGVFGLYLVSSLGAAAFFTTAGTLSSRYDLRVLQAGSLCMRGLLMPLVAIVGTALGASIPGTVLVGLVFVGIGVAWAVIAVTAGTIVTRIAPPSVRGEALGLHAALVAVASGLGSVGGGALATASGYTTAFAVAGVVIALGATLVFTLRSISTTTDRVGETPPESADDRTDVPSSE